MRVVCYYFGRHGGQSQPQRHSQTLFMMKVNYLWVLSKCISFKIYKKKKKKTLSSIHKIIICPRKTDGTKFMKHLYTLISIIKVFIAWSNV